MPKRLLAFSSILLLAACAAPVKNGESDPNRSTVAPVPATRSGTGSGAVIFVAEFKGHALAGLANTACRWRMIHKETQRAVFVNVDPKAPVTVGRLEPGTYQTSNLGCGLSRVWALEDLFKEGYVVEPGKASYLGKLVFEFKNNTLDAVKKAPRTESAQNFQAASAAVPEQGMEMISGFTGRTITRDMLETGELRDGFDLQAKGVTDANKQLAPLMNDLKTCANQETADPLRIGRLDYVASYKQSRFVEMKSREEQNAFSDRLRSCVERSMMAFHPDAKNDVEVRVRY